MVIEKGLALGPYELLGRLGEGGMGEVWRARDRRIQRDVAVKFLHQKPGTDEDDVRRFEQEARTAAALNHPGLATIFDVGSVDGVPYLVMELLEGRTLREMLEASGLIPIRKAVDYAARVAEALAVTHEKGITHRDLKPENIFITSDERVKVFDFGLAKLAGNATDHDSSHRTAKRLTSAGIVVGTPAYMSPEQVRAQPIDHRSDLFSLGTLLHEMLSGRHPFEGESPVETMHAVANVDPPRLTTLRANVSPALDAVVHHCLEKNPRDRFQSARDLAFQLRVLADLDVPGPGMPAQIAPRTFSRRAVIGIGAAMLMAAAGALAIFRFRGDQPRPSQRVLRQLTFGDGMEMFPALAPDGKSFVYVSAESGNRDIYLQRVDGRSSINITGDSPDDDAEPAFSPDGGQIAFRSERDGGGIFVMGATGESVRRLTDFGHNPSWAPDGKRIVVSTAATELRPHVHRVEGELWIIDSSTGAKRVLRAGNDSDALQPSWSPHGSRIAFWGVDRRSGQRDIWTIEPDAPEPLRTVVRVTTDASMDWNPVWSPDGTYLYHGSNRDGTMNLWRVPMNEKSGRPAGEPELLSLPAALSGNFNFSRSGDLAFTAATRSYRVLAIPFDPQTAATGDPRALYGSSQEILTADVSPDGRQLAFTTGGTQEDLFVVNADGTRLRQFTNDAARDREPRWSRDGKTLYWFSNRQGSSYHIWSIRADGSGLARVTDERDSQRAGIRHILMPDTSPDGTTLAVETQPVASALVHLDRPFGQRLDTLIKGIAPLRWSPDGRRLAGIAVGADGVDRPGIVVHSLETRRTVQVLDRGGDPQWLPDGNHVVFFERESIGILDLDSRAVITHALTLPPGSSFGPSLARDGSALYVGQILERGDIWMLPAGEK